LELSFKSQKLKRICEDKDFSKKYYSEDQVKKLIARITDLRAIQKFDDLPIQLVRTVHKGKMAISIDQCLHLIIEGIPAPIPVLKDGWSKVLRIKIVSIEALS